MTAPYVNQQSDKVVLGSNIVTRLCSGAVAKYSPKLSKEVRAFLSHIGAIGGQTSRRHLSRRQAKQMVAIREFKKAAMKAGKMEVARKRIPLPKEKLKLPPPPPAVAPQRWLHHPRP